MYGLWLASTLSIHLKYIFVGTQNYPPIPPISQKKQLDTKLQRLSLFLATPYERGGATAVGNAPLPGRTRHQPGRNCETRRAREGVPDDRGAGITSPSSCLAHGRWPHEDVARLSATPHAGEVFQEEGERESRRPRAPKAQPWPEATGRENVIGTVALHLT
jgi:hypothetical protein